MFTTTLAKIYATGSSLDYSIRSKTTSWVIGGTVMKILNPIQLHVSINVKAHIVATLVKG